MHSFQLETITHSLPPPILSHDSTILNKKATTNLPFQRHQHQPTKENSLSINHSHFDKQVNSSTYASVIESCECPNLGKQIHGHTLKTGFHGHEFVETKLLQMYGKFGYLDDAVLVFDKMPSRNLYSWTAILGVHVNHGLFQEAVLLFQELQFEDIELEFFVFPIILKTCSGLGALKLGRQIHGIVMKCRIVSNAYVGNALIDMYGKCGSLIDAKRVLMTMTERDCISWNSVVTACAANGMVYEALECLEKMYEVDNSTPNHVSWSAVIGGFSQNGCHREAIELLSRMQAAGLKPNARIVASVLPSCASLQLLSLGKEIHGYIIRHWFVSNPFVVNGLVDVYRRCADMGSALKIFSKFSVKNVVSFNTIIVGYCKNGDISKAKELFDQMEQLGTKRDIISWNSMLSGYVDNFLFDEALSIFQDLLMEEDIEPDSFTLGSAITACADMACLRRGKEIQACADMACLRRGKEIHAHAIVKGLQSNPFVGGALVEMYSKCQDLAAAKRAFDEVADRDIATWNALISGYARCNEIENVQNLLQKMKEEDGFEPDIYTWNGVIAGHVENGHHESALRLFSNMQTSTCRPDIYTVGIVLPACSRLATIERGKQVHAYSIRCGYDTDVHIGAAIVDMYAKCGSIKHAVMAYNRIPNPDLVSQNAMLTAYAMHGHGEEGIALFRKMLLDDDGDTTTKPDHVTFLSVLSSCVHAGSVETGNEFFNLMMSYDISPSLKHYTCMVDLLSRAGLLNEAHDLIKEMPMEPDVVVWGALLGGCVIHQNVELGEIAAEKLLESEPNNTGNYVLLANLYAYAGRWSDLARIRQMMTDRGMQKSPGCSWIEGKDEIHVFLACDRSHSRTEEIYTTLEHLTLQMRTGFTYSM